MRRVNPQAAEGAEGSPRRSLEQYLLDRGMRRTPERYAILEHVLTFGRLFTAEDVISSMADDIFHVSDATVYNALQLFTAAGILRRHNIDNSPALYENLPAQAGTTTVQLVCTECGAIRTAREPEVDELLRHRRYPSFSRRYFTLHIYGICSRCARRKKKAAASQKHSAKTQNP